MVPLSEPESSRTPRLGVVLVALVTGLVFGRALFGELVYDDLLLIGSNPTLTSLANLPDTFGRGYWDFLAPGEAKSIGYWRPFPAMAHLLAWRLSGESVLALHLVSLLAHRVATLAAIRLGRVLSGSAWVGLAAGLLFGVHPLHVESVAWISALNDPLFGAFSMASLASFALWRARGSDGRPLAAAALFAGALLSKEMGACVLPLLAVVEWLRAKREGRGVIEAVRHRAVPAFAPFVFVFVVYLGVRMAVFGSATAGFDRITTDFGVKASRLALLRVELFGGGAELIAWPRDLTLFRRFRPDLVWTSGQGLRFALTSLVLVSGLVIAWRRKHAGLALAMAGFVPLWLFASLAPVLLRVESLGRFPVSDRFYYLAVFALALAVPVVVRRLTSERAALGASVLVAALFGVQAFQRTAVWASESMLFEAEAAHSPRSVYALWGLGRVRLDAYRRSNQRADLDSAIEIYERAQDLLIEAKQPDSDLFVGSRDFLQVRLGYGWTQLFLAQSEGYGGSSTATYLFESLAQDLLDIRFNEERAKKHGIDVKSEYLEIEQVQTALGVAYMFEGRLDEAENAFRHALKSNPNHPEAYQNLGRLAERRGDYRAALQNFEHAQRLRPQNLEDAILVAQMRFQAGETERAAADARALLATHPDAAPLELLLASAAMTEGDTATAMQRIDRTLSLDPEYSQAHYLRGKALIARGRPQDAIVSLRRAGELAPADFPAAYDLAVLLLNNGAIDTAADPLLRAYALAPSREMASQLRAPLTQIDWKDPKVLHDLAVVDTRRQDLDAAEFWLSRGLTMVPGDPALLMQLGRVLRIRKRFDEAIVAMTTSLDKVDSIEGRAELAGLLLELERRPEARAALERALTVDPPANWPRERVEGVRQAIRAQLNELGQ